MCFLERSLGQKKVIWLEESNRYMLVELPAYNVITQLLLGQEKDAVLSWLHENYRFTKKESLRLIADMELLLENQLTESDKFAGQNHFENSLEPLEFAIKKYYSILNQVFFVEYETQELAYIFHPKFEQLEIEPSSCFDHRLQAFQAEDYFVLAVNGTTVGKWHSEEIHFLSGKFSMEIVNCLYGKKESDWMAVFHASTISRNNESLIFCGDSGSGKSTLIALLLANGYNLVADDFVPVDAIAGEVFYFPAAVSIKKNALDFLSPFFPQLNTAQEFYYAGTEKTVKYLYGAFENSKCPNCSVRAIVFIKYDKDIELEFKEIPKYTAFQQLVPDSWISRQKETVDKFLDWFLEKPCYQLKYSDNKKIIDLINKFFRNEL